MAEIARLIGMLQASAAENALKKKALDDGLAPLTTIRELPIREFPKHDFSEPEFSAAQYVLNKKALDHGLAPLTPICEFPKHDFSESDVSESESSESETSSAEFSPVAGTFREAQAKKRASLDIANVLAVGTCRRIFAASANPRRLDTIARRLGVAVPTVNMAGRFPALSTSNLPPASAAEAAATASPARGTAMLSSIFKSVRVPEFRFKWQFWAEKGQQSSASKDKSVSLDELASRPKPLGEQIISVKEFYQHFNNIPVENLKLRDSIHLFHLGVKPLWEDPRNEKGGAYYFRVSKETAPQFWHEMCLLSVGDVLQGAVETKRECK